jgi:3-polyprenyl-4-hydroxybenzoate decarboxylase
MEATVPAQLRLIVGIFGVSGVVYGLRVLTWQRYRYARCWS